MLIGEPEIRQLLNEQHRLRKQVTELQEANNREIERRRAAETEARRCRTALARTKHVADKLGRLPFSVVDQIIEPALAGQDGPKLFRPPKEDVA